MLGLRLTAVKPPYLYDHSTTGSVVLQYLSLPTSWDDKQILAKAFEMSVNVSVHNWLAVWKILCLLLLRICWDDFEMCFAPQRRALFRHLNFQKWSDHGVFCTF